VAQVVECLFRECEAVSSNLNTTKINKYMYFFNRSSEYL
jgi:hypothetical protein